LVDAPLAHEVAQNAIDAALDLLLSDQTVAPAVPGTVEQLPARDGAARMADLARAEVVEHIAQILGSVAQLLTGLSLEQREIVGERHDAPIAREGFADVGAERAELGRYLLA